MALIIIIIMNYIWKTNRNFKIKCKKYKNIKNQIKKNTNSLLNFTKYVLVSSHSVNIIIGKDLVILNSKKEFILI